MLYSTDLRRALVFVLLFGIAASPVFGQIGTSTITGRVNALLRRGASECSDHR